MVLMSSGVLCTPHCKKIEDKIKECDDKRASERARKGLAGEKIIVALVGDFSMMTKLVNAQLSQISLSSHPRNVIKSGGSILGPP